MPPLTVIAPLDINPVNPENGVVALMVPPPANVTVPVPLSVPLSVIEAAPAEPTVGSFPSGNVQVLVICRGPDV